VAWFEMTGSGLREIDPARCSCPARRRWRGGGAAARGPAGARVEVQALVAGGDAGTGPEAGERPGPRRFQLVAAVLETVGIRLGRADAFGATAAGSVWTTRRGPGTLPPRSRPPRRRAGAKRDRVRRRDRADGDGPTGAGMTAAVAAGAAGLRTVFVPEASDARRRRQVPVRHVLEALAWAVGAAGRARSARAS
jgi:hypothetical protein